MTGILIAVLFVLQIAGFYMIVLLYLRAAKVDETERKQKQIMKEMEDSFALYISEIKEENERLIQQLSKHREDKSEMTFESKTIQTDYRDEVAAASSYFNTKPSTSKVLNSYRTSQQQASSANVDSLFISDNRAKETEFEKVYRLSEQGLTTTEIASQLGKGKTEVELIMKFKE
ncbi:hypothetical protein [Sporosarcina aquimarina]|uniref:Swarming motility protein SwrB n=1 Tax=Sporosarcina aquimarina TaxID=114975 RepID=A0ABU4FWX5_9BACL|nr:hypothetical protein [Sporosarcina aquimarina]MDW0109203.1 hypothetical protein [Sporosarcina aquimarina]